MRKLIKVAVKLFMLAILLSLTSLQSFGQHTGPVYVDNQGVLRWKQHKEEAAFFGVNYTTSFAYAYRAHKALNVDLEKAIDEDVYHLARLGLDAFRVHMWETEITDAEGNLLNNDHLRLFDYLIHKLKQRNIKILLTPIAFWGNGYPEPDEKTISYSSNYNKGQATVNEQSIKAQERYVQQLLQHVNPYTNLSYLNDPDIIAAEINNEPRHSGPKEQVTAYINRLAAAIRSTGWTKPVFYNISENSSYADATAAAAIDGVSFQWYPSGLVANRTLHGNFLPHVDQYTIPFDTIPAFANKASMVYEFDAGDILQPIMYPAMARSFRKAGIQWATQFAYDPLALAYGNTEYQTHYLNLAYTPAKAISLMIASEAFHKVPRNKSYGTYPADSVFDVFRVSYKEQLSEMNALQKFYYTGTTRTKPVNAARLEHIAGVGSSQVVQYQGKGAYFLDKVDKGVWRLEVMPDAIPIRDPFAKASPQKEVTRIQWQEHQMQINLAELGAAFSVKGLNEGNSYQAKARNNSFQIKPGTYLLVKEGRKSWKNQDRPGVIGLNEFVAPQPFSTDTYVAHEPYAEVTAGKPFVIKANVVGVHRTDTVTLLLNSSGRQHKGIPMQLKAGAAYQAEVPAEAAVPGRIAYRILVKKGNGEYVTFPGNHPGNPFAWDYYQTDAWQTYVASETGAMELFNPTQDQHLYVYPNLWRSDVRQLLTGDKPGQLILRLTNKELTGEGVMGWQFYFGDKIKGRETELPSMQKLVIRARTTNTAPVQAKVALITADAAAFAATITLNNTLQDIEIPLSSMQPASFLLLPRPYPGFHPFKFKLAKQEPFNLQQAEKFEITIGENVPPSEKRQPYSFEVEGVWLEKSDKQL